MTDLAKAQVEFDLGCEDVIARVGSANGAKFVVGQRGYDTVVLPPFTENLNARTAELLEAYLEKGGMLLVCEPATLSRIDGQESPRAAAILGSANCKRVETGQLPSALRERVKDGFSVTRPANDGGILYHHRRQLADGDLVFFANTSIEMPTHATVRSPAKGVQQWDLDTGACQPYPSSADGIEVDLPPCGSLLLFLAHNEQAQAPRVEVTKGPQAVVQTTPLDVHRVRPNVLLLDFVTVTAGGETKENVHCQRASQFVFQKNGMRANPWDHAVQFRDEFLAKTFPADSGFKATYTFVVDSAPPKPVYAVVERADLYKVTCNGKPVAVDRASWWLDKAFVKMDVSEMLQSGENQLTIEASPFTVFHEVEATYIVGEFSLKASDKGFTIVPAQVLQLGPWNEQGYPLYGDAVSYTAGFDVASVSDTYRVSLPKWLGSVAEVMVNGKSAGYIYQQPFRLDVTKQLTKGHNAVEVVVYGTLKNTMGPHHGNPPLGIASPGAFDKVKDPGPPPGSTYSTIGYGLFEPFVLSKE